MEMPKAIQMLMCEHRQIERVLFSLEQFSELLLKRSDRVDPLDLQGFITFLQEFADRAHHSKEENHLFKMLTDQGFPSEHGPVAVMLSEHELGRDQVRVLSQIAERDPENWTEADLEKIRDTAHFFSRLLASHIQKEDRILYPMSTQHLNSAQFEQLELRFSALEHEQEKQGHSSLLRTLGARLFETYGEGFSPESFQPELGCGSH